METQGYWFRTADYGRWYLQINTLNIVSEVYKKSPFSAWFRVWKCSVGQMSQWDKCPSGTNVPVGQMSSGTTVLWDKCPSGTNVPVGQMSCGTNVSGTNVQWDSCPVGLMSCGTIVSGTNVTPPPFLHLLQGFRFNTEIYKDYIIFITKLFCTCLA